MNLIVYPEEIRITKEGESDKQFVTKLKKIMDKIDGII